MGQQQKRVCSAYMAHLYTPFPSHVLHQGGLFVCLFVCLQDYANTKFKSGDGFLSNIDPINQDYPFQNEQLFLFCVLSHNIFHRKRLKMKNFYN